MQEVVELVIFALIALLVGTGVVWLAGWLLGLVGTVLTWLAGLVWSLLRFLVPIAVVAGAVYLLVKLMNRSAERVAGEPQKQPATPPSPWTMSKEPGKAEQASDEAPAGEAGAAAGAESGEPAATSGPQEPGAEEPETASDEARKPSPGAAADASEEAREAAGETSDTSGEDAGVREDEDEDDERRGGQPG